jgi:queuosine biosynthesis protein
MREPGVPDKRIGLHSLNFALRRRERSLEAGCYAYPSMRLAELDYELPPELIAQHPAADRDDSRLMVMDRREATFEHSRFRKLGAHLREGDLISFSFPGR